MFGREDIFFESLRVAVPVACDVGRSETGCFEKRSIRLFLHSLTRYPTLAPKGAIYLEEGSDIASIKRNAPDKLTFAIE